MHAGSLPMRNLFLLAPKAPCSFGNIHRRHSSILIQGSLFCLTEPKSGCASLTTSQEGHVASNSRNKPIKTTHLFLGAGQRSLERRVAEGRYIGGQGQPDALAFLFLPCAWLHVSGNCAFSSSCYGPLTVSPGTSQAPKPHQIVCSFINAEF